MNKTIAILGAGGHGKVVGEIAFLNHYKTIDFFYDNKFKKNKKFPFSIVGTFDDLKNYFKNYNAFFRSHW